MSERADPPWGLVWALSATQIVAWGTAYYAFGVMLVPMQQEFGWAQSVLTAAYSMALGIAAVVLVPVRRVDRSRRRPPPDDARLAARGGDVRPARRSMIRCSGST